MATQYEIVINMDANTQTQLKDQGFNLYGFKAVSSPNAECVPLVWFSVATFGAPTSITWMEQYQAYDSQTTNLSPDVTVVASNNYDIDLNQTLNLNSDGSGVGQVTNDGTANAISINNQSTTPFTCGISQTNPNGITPLCAFPLDGLGLQVIVPIEKVLLMFATKQVNTGTVIEKAYTQGIFIDLTAENTQTVTFDINGGWDWGNEGWATAIAANENLVPILISDPNKHNHHQKK